MKDLEEDARQLRNLLTTTDEFSTDAARFLKNEALIKQCTRFEAVLRVIDGQDLNAPFDGRMRHRETALALTKLDEVRMWMQEHFRVRASLGALVETHVDHVGTFEQYKEQRQRIQADIQNQARAAQPAEGVQPYIRRRLREIDEAKAAHASDCATHNEPAKPAEPCDCAEYAETPRRVYLDFEIRKLCHEGEPDVGDVPIPPEGYSWQFNYANYAEAAAAGTKRRFLVKDAVDEAE